MVIFSLLKFIFYFVPFINQVDRYTVFIAESLTNGNCFGLNFFLEVLLVKGSCVLLIIAIVFR